MLKISGILISLIPSMIFFWGGGGNLQQTKHLHLGGLF